MRLSPQEFERISQLSPLEKEGLPFEIKEAYVLDLSELEAQRAAAAEQAQYDRAILLSDYEYKAQCERKTQDKLAEASSRCDVICASINQLMIDLAEIKKTATSVTCRDADFNFSPSEQLLLVKSIHRWEQNKREIGEKIKQLFQELKQLREQVSKEDWHVSNIIQLDKHAAMLFRQVVKADTALVVVDNITQANWHDRLGILEHVGASAVYEVNHVKRVLNAFSDSDQMHSYVQTRSSFIHPVACFVQEEQLRAQTRPNLSLLLVKYQHGLTPDLYPDWDRLHQEQQAVNQGLPLMRSMLQRRGDKQLLETLKALQAALSSDWQLAQLGECIKELIVVETALEEHLSKVSLQSLREQDEYRQGVLTQMGTAVMGDIAKLREKIGAFKASKKDLIAWQDPAHCGAYNLQILSAVENLDQQAAVVEIRQMLDLIRPFTLAEDPLMKVFSEIENGFTTYMAELKAIPAQIEQEAPRLAAVQQASKAYMDLVEIYAEIKRLHTAYTQTSFQDEQAKLQALELLLAKISEQDQAIVDCSERALDPYAFADNVAGSGYKTEHSAQSVAGFTETIDRIIQSLEEEKTSLVRAIALKQGLAELAAHLAAQQVAAHEEAKRKFEEERHKAAEAKLAAQRQAEEKAAAKAQAEAEKTAAKQRAEEAKLLAKRQAEAEKQRQAEEKAAAKRQAEAAKLEAKRQAEEEKRKGLAALAAELREYEAARNAEIAAQLRAKLEAEQRQAEEKAAAKQRAEEEKRKAQEEKAVAKLKAEEARQAAELHKKIEAGQRFNRSVDAYVQLAGRTGFSLVTAHPTTSAGKKLTIPNVFEATDFDEILDAKDIKSTFGL